VRVRRWQAPEEPIPKRPYRNSAIFHAVLACLIVLVAWATGGSLRNAVIVAAGFFVLATAWSWTQWRRRLALEQRRQATRPRREGTGTGERAP
jgi:hypothetical protein